MESRGYYEEKSWDNLKVLSQGASDRANNLRIIMESLGIIMTPNERTTSSANNLDQANGMDASEEAAHPNPEGGESRGFVYWSRGTTHGSRGSADD